MVGPVIENMICVILCLAEHHWEMMVIKRVIDLVSLALRTHQAAITKYAKLMRNCRFRNSHLEGKVAHTHGTLLQSVKYFDSRNISQRLECLCYYFNDALRWFADFRLHRYSRFDIWSSLFLHVFSSLSICSYTR